jgi:hypothetical protein
MKDHLAGVTPLPFGARIAPPRRWRWSGRWFRLSPARVRRGLLAGGVIALLCGAVLLVWPAPQITVSMDGGSYRVGGNRLVEVAPGLYRGDGVMLLTHQADGSIVAASSFAENGHTARGACRLDQRIGTERCTFWLAGNREISAFDVYRSGGWDRRYASGPDVRIASGTMLPVPFPIGS